MVPINRQYPLEMLISAVKEYTLMTNRRVTFEYVMLDDVNVSQQDAEAMIKAIKTVAGECKPDTL